MWTKKERFLAVLNGELADRPPISAWRHFTETEHGTAQEFAESMLSFQNKYDWDYMKMQPRATYYEEAWGGEFDYNNYGGKVVAPCTKSPIRCLDDLEKIVELSASAPPFAEQIEAARLIQQGMTDDTPLFQTISCPTSIFQKLFAIEAIGRYRAADRSDMMVTLMKEHPALVHKTLQNITRSMANFSQELMKTGICGVFYAATGLSRTDYLTREEWEEFVKPYDLALMEALKPGKIMLHACGYSCNPERFADYPIDILHWPESATDNPALNSAPSWINGITPMGGVDERLFGQNKSEEIAQLTRNTLLKMKDIPFVLAPDCSMALTTTNEEILAFRDTARNGIL